MSSIGQQCRTRETSGGPITGVGVTSDSATTVEAPERERSDVTTTTPVPGSAGESAGEFPGTDGHIASGGAGGTGGAVGTGGPAVAWLPVGLLAGAVAVVLGITSAWYGWFGDELYFLSAGARPALGYADQPPLLPLLAAAAHAIAPGSLVVLRLPATLLTAGQVVIAAVLAAELGGRRRAQLTAAAAAAIGIHLLAGGHLLATSTIDPFFWALLLLLLVRWIRTGRDRLLLAMGGVTGLALAGKFLIPILLVGLLVGVAVAGPRRMLGRPLLWVGMVVAVLSTVPTLWWQATHGWPQMQMGSVVAGESGLFGNRWQFVPRALYFAGLMPGAVLVLVGLWGLLRSTALRPWRGIGIAVLVVTAILLAAGGRPYYLAGFHTTLFAAGAVAAQDLAARDAVARWWRWTLSTASFLISGMLVAALVLPIGPAAPRARFDFQIMGQVGWPAFADGVAAAWATRPPAAPDSAAVVTYSYWYAAALEHEGPARGLPAAIHSPHRGFGYFGPPPDTATTVLLVGKVRWAMWFCAELRPLPPYHGREIAPVNDRVQLAWCRPREPWSRAWPSLRYMD